MQIKPRMGLAQQVSDEGKEVNSMRKFQVVSLMMGAVIALYAFTAPSALAVSKILANGAEVTAALLISSSGAIILQQLNTIVGTVKVLCEGIFDGLVESGGVLVELNEVLLSDGILTPDTGKDLTAERTGDQGECVDVENCPNPLVVALDLPWHQELELEGGKYFLDYLPVTELGIEGGYFIECEAFIKFANYCDGLIRAELLEDANGDLNGEFNPATSGRVKCSDGGESEVISESLVVGGPLEEPLVDSDGALLTLSE